MIRVVVEDHEHVRVLKLNRPDKKNAIDVRLAIELVDALETADEDDLVRCVILTSVGNVFCGGADVNLFLAIGSGDSDTVAAVSKIHTTLEAFKKPLIAAVQGPAVGMGVTLLPFFDMVYASEKASFLCPFVRLGLILEFASSWTLPRLIGRQRANEIMFRASPIDARTAEDWGLVTRCFAPEALHGETLRIALDIASQPASAVAACKRLLRLGEQDASPDLSIARENRDLASRYGSEENKQAVAAFLESRKKKS